MRFIEGYPFRNFYPGLAFKKAHKRFAWILYGGKEQKLAIFKKEWFFLFFYYA